MAIRAIRATVLATLFPLFFAGAQGASAVAAPSHGLAMHGEPALPADFDHLPYADPQARQSGRLQSACQGAFDSLNPFNLKAGSTAQGLEGNVIQRLMARSLDEPFTVYGVLARSIEVDDSREHVTFRLDPRARFSDGAPLTSADVRFSFDLLKAKGRPQQRSAYGLVKRVETPDAQTISFDLPASMIASCR